MPQNSVVIAFPNTSPELPINLPECLELQERAADKRHRLVGWFGENLYMRRWYRLNRFPTFQEHARAAMAVPWLPEDMKEDADLQSEFPPQHINTKKYARSSMLLAGRYVGMDNYAYECVRG